MDVDVVSVDVEVEVEVDVVSVDVDVVPVGADGAADGGADVGFNRRPRNNCEGSPALVSVARGGV